MENAERFCQELYDCLEENINRACAEAYKANANNPKISWYPHEANVSPMAAKLDLMYWDETPQGDRYWDQVWKTLEHLGL